MSTITTTPATTNRIVPILVKDEGKIVNDEIETSAFTTAEIKNQVYIQAAMRSSKTVEPVDILFAVVKQANGPAGIILRDVVRDFPNQLAKDDPVSYLKQRYREYLIQKSKPSTNGFLNQKAVLGDVATNVLDKVESIDILKALFTVPESIQDIAYFGIDPQEVIKKIDSYLRSRQG